MLRPRRLLIHMSPWSSSAGLIMGAPDSKSSTLEGSDCAPAPARGGLPFTCTFASNPRLLQILPGAFIHTEWSRKKKKIFHVCRVTLRLTSSGSARCLPFRLLLLFLLGIFFFTFSKPIFSPTGFHLSPILSSFFHNRPLFFFPLPSFVTAAVLIQRL